MRVVTLSDHPRAALRDDQDDRLLADERALADYGKDLARHRTVMAEVRARRDEAWCRRNWSAWLREILTEWNERRRAPRRPPLPAASAQERLLTRRLDDELLIQQHLGRALNDDWVLFHGYQNAFGEIDHLLLGPAGLFSIELGSHRKASEASDVLQRLLDQRPRPVILNRIVLPAHARSMLNSYENRTVLVAADIARALMRIADSRTTLLPATRIETEQLIQRTHHYRL